MVIVVTGMVGLDKKSYLRKVCQLAGRRGRDVLLFNVGDMMYAEAPDIGPGRILDIPLKRLSSLRRSVFKDIIAKAAKAPNVIVNTHATFRWRHGLFPAVDFDQMRQLDADMYLCLIGGVVDLHARLTKEHATEHSLKDLVVWREEEIIATEMLCKGIDETIAFYCLARGMQGETIEMFYRLCFEQQWKKAYLSFPMTGVWDKPDVRVEIDQFRCAMKELFTCFDPGDLEESDLPYRAHKAATRGEDFVEVAATGGTINLALDEVRQVERDINSQIYARDFLLIEQADMIISLIPTSSHGSAMISSGVERELQHAHEAAKQVYVIWTAQQSPSVFVTQTATKVFETVTEAVGFFREKMAVRGRR